MGSTKSTYSSGEGQVLYSASSFKRGTGKVSSPACPKGQDGSGSPSPWHWPAHGEVGQKIQRISAQARPDIPFQGKHCQCQAGGCAASSQRGSGGLAPLHMGSFPMDGKATDLEVNIPSSPQLHDLPSQVQAFNFDPHSTLGAGTFPGSPGTAAGRVTRVQSPGKQGCG